MHFVLCRTTLLRKRSSHSDRATISTAWRLQVIAIIYCWQVSSTGRL